MTQLPDDFDSARTIVTALEKFEPKDQERILRMAREKLGLSTETYTSASKPSSVSNPLNPPSPIGTDQEIRKSVDIKSFVNAKDPKSDNQLAAVVAYFYKFEALQQERKDAIGSAELQEACRLSGRNRLGDPAKTLRNAHGVGLLDKAGVGAFSISTVGENLVAMTLPAGDAKRIKKLQRKPRKKK